MTYYKSCAFMNFDVPFFKHNEYTDEDMNRFCGYESTYDSKQKKCVGNKDTYCSTIAGAIFENLPRASKFRKCNEMGCKVAIGNKECEMSTKCSILLSENACKQDPNCKWSSWLNECERDNVNLSNKVINRCGFFGWFDHDTIDVKSLCDESSTEYNTKFNVCDRKTKI